MHYVRYWESILSIPRGTGNEPINVSLPQPCSRELRRIRLYDMLNVEEVYFVISEMQKFPNQVYCPIWQYTKSLVWTIILTNQFNLLEMFVSHSTKNRWEADFSVAVLIQLLLGMACYS
ncbi:hypothetical protein K1719_004369 [Acacia pycnantha]|nr:hypothetical protein K1719_004369 [Acacia pycnantha]